MNISKEFKAVQTINDLVLDLICHGQSTPSYQEIPAYQMMEESLKERISTLKALLQGLNLNLVPAESIREALMKAKEYDTYESLAFDTLVVDSRHTKKFFFEELIVPQEHNTLVAEKKWLYTTICNQFVNYLSGSGGLVNYQVMDMKCSDGSYVPDYEALIANVKSEKQKAYIRKVEADKKKWAEHGDKHGFAYNMVYITFHMCGDYGIYQTPCNENYSLAEILHQAAKNQYTVCGKCHDIPLNTEKSMEDK